MVRESSSSFLTHELPRDSLQFYSREMILKKVVRSTSKHFGTKKKHLNPNTYFEGLQLVEILAGLWSVIRVLIHLFHLVL